MRAKEFLHEAYDVSRARIDHPEDLVVTAGSSGARLAIQLLQQAVANSQDISIKPDGKPAIKWGRDANGFAMGDKYMRPLPHSTEELEQLLSQRRGGTNTYLLNLYRKLWEPFKNSVPNINGFLFGDLLYSKTPPIQNGQFVIKPNTVEYTVPVRSALGQRIAASEAGIVVHTYIPVDSNTGTHVNNISDIPGVNVNGALLLIDDNISSSTRLKDPGLAKISSAVAKHATSIDAFLDDGTLSTKRIKALTGLLIKYINDRVRSRNYNNLAEEFVSWIQSNASKAMANNITSHINEHPQGYAAMFAIFLAISAAKQSLIDQLDNTPSNISANIAGTPGHEGYLVHSSQGPVKLVDRFKFSAANFGV